MESVDITKYIVNCNKEECDEYRKKFNEICEEYGLAKLNKNLYHLKDMSFMFVFRPLEIIVVPKNDNYYLDLISYFVGFHNLHKYSHFNFIFSTDIVNIGSLQGLVEFLELINLYKKTKDSDASVVKVELSEFEKRLLKK